MRHRYGFGLVALLSPLLAVACGQPTHAAVEAGTPGTDQTTEPEAQSAGASVPSVRSSLAGQPVRGTSATITITGLEEFRGKTAILTVSTKGPVHTFSGGDRMGYAILPPASVDESGATTVAFDVPNTLSGEDDIIPLTPGQDYLVVVTTEDDRQGVQIALPFSVIAAELGTAYSVRLTRSDGECDAPPAWIAFDGENWLSASGGLLEAKTTEVTGMITVLSEGVARFELPDGTVTIFTRATTGWGC